MLVINNCRNRFLIELENLLAAIKRGEHEISPSTLYAVACVLEGVPYINGSPQNTFVPGLLELAVQKGVHIAGDDFKSGQTKMKSVLTDFLISAGLKVMKFLLEYLIFRFLQLFHTTILETMTERTSVLLNNSDQRKLANRMLLMIWSSQIKFSTNQMNTQTTALLLNMYPMLETGSHNYFTSADFTSKRALDEYISEIFMGGHNTIAIHNTCEDSLLAAPIMLDLIIIAEMMDRITYKTKEMNEFETFHPVLSILSFLCKAPLVPQNTPVVNALFKQRAQIDNIFRACVGLPPENNMRLEYQTKFPTRF